MVDRRQLTDDELPARDRDARADGCGIEIRGARTRLALARRWTGPAIAVALTCVLAVAWRGERLIPVASPAAELASPEAAPAAETPQRSPAERTVARVGGAPVPNDALDDPMTVAQARPRDARKEKDFYAEFLALAAPSVAALESAAPHVLAREGPDCEKVALLRALHASGSTHTGESFVSAIASLPDVSTAQGESVPRFALRFLSERAASEPDARRALERVVWGADPPVASDLRRVGVMALAAAAAEAELRNMASRLAAERDPSVRQNGVDALARGAHPDAARRALHELGLSPTVAEPAITDG